MESGPVTEQFNTGADCAAARIVMQTKIRRMQDTNCFMPIFC
jgi:hypothetical protein